MYTCKNGWKYYKLCSKRLEYGEKKKATNKGWDSEFWVKLLKISIEEIIAPLYLGKYKTLHELNSSFLCCVCSLN